MLDGEGEKWMRSAGRGPRIFVGAEEPDGVCGEARRLGGAGDENGRVLGLRREESFVHGAVEDNEEIAPRNTPAIEAKRCAVVDGVLPAAEELKLRAREWTCAGPSGNLN